MSVSIGQVHTVAKAGSTGLLGDVTLTGGTGITLTQSGQDISIAFSGSAGLGDPGSNGFVDRTALNTTAARTLTGTTNQITITNGGGGGNPVFSLPQNYDTAATPQLGGLGVGVAAAAGSITLDSSGIAATSTDGLILSNPTAATVGAQKWSKRIRLAGNGWKTNATAGSQAVDFWLETIPQQGAATPDAYLALTETINGASVKAFQIGALPTLFGTGSSGYFAIYPGGVTPSGTNYGVLIRNDGNLSYFNSLTELRLLVNNTLMANATSSGFAVGGSGQTAWSGTTGLLTTYGSAATAARGKAVIFASVATTGATASVGATNLQVGGAVAPAGLYHICVYLVYTTTGGATISIDLAWTDPGQAQTKNLVAALSGVAKNYHESRTVVRADGIANITYAITITGRTTDVFAYYVTLERLQ